MVFDIKYYDTLPSTNSEAIQLALQGAKEGTVVTCGNQTAGRGQRDNKWLAKASENITMSVILRPKIDVSRLFLISKAFSLAVVNVLVKYHVNTCVKWPNDIYASNKKIAGILLEHSFLGNNFNFSVIGLGLNVNQTDFPQMENAPTSIINETGKQYNITEVLTELLNEFNCLYPLLNTSGETINKEYFTKLYRLNGYHKYKQPDGEIFSAKIVNVADSGEIHLEDSSGNLRTYFFKEVEYIKD